MSYINGMAIPSLFSPNDPLQIQLPHEDEHQRLPSSAMPPCHNLQDLAAVAPLLSPVLGKRSVSLSRIGKGSDNVHDITKAEDELYDDGMQAGEKKRRLNTEQVRALERSFDLQGNKLESERKLQLATALGLQPRQVAIWFQNRRARWKAKQLEMDYEVLKTQFDAFKSQNETLKQHNQKLQSEILALKGRETASEVINLNKETEGPCSNRSENSPDINLDAAYVSRTSAANLDQFQSIRPAEIEQYCYKNVENIVEDGSFSNLLCSMGDHYQAPFWSWSEHLHFH